MSDNEPSLQIDLDLNDIERSASSVVEAISNKNIENKRKRNVIFLIAGTLPIADIVAHTSVKPELIFPPEQPDMNAKLLEQINKNHQDIHILQHIHKPITNSHNLFAGKHYEQTLKTRYTNLQFNQLKKKYRIIKTKHK